MGQQLATGRPVNHLGRWARQWADPPLPEPTATLPGTRARLAVYERRAAAGLALHHPDDRHWGGEPLRPRLVPTEAKGPRRVRQRMSGLRVYKLFRASRVLRG
jgi:hypothetical protein